MTLTNFSKYFFNMDRPSTIVSFKKPATFFKEYLLCIKQNTFYCFDFFKYITLFKKVIYFIQAVATKGIPFVFFFENLYFYPLIKSLVLDCNEHYCYLPLSFTWLSDWSPIFFNRNFRYRITNFLYSRGVAITINTKNTLLLKTLITSSWPTISYLPLEVRRLSYPKALSLLSSIYIVPTSSFLSVSEYYLKLNMFSKIIQAEKLRVLV